MARKDRSHSHTRARRAAIVAALARHDERGARPFELARALGEPTTAVAKDLYQLGRDRIAERRGRAWRLTLRPSPGPAH